MKHLMLAVFALFGFATTTTDVRAADWRDAILGNTTYDSAPAAKSRAARPTAQKAAPNVAQKAARPAKTRTASYEAPSAPAPRAARRTASRSGIAAPARALSKPIYGGGSGSETGVASYYWQPQALASGGRFNPNAMTAAHKTLPFGTRVRVTDNSTGRSVVVTINDRGPYIKGRIIDLSKAAAGSLGITGRGVAPVSVARL
jgi:rare lipoprotein A